MGKPLEVELPRHRGCAAVARRHVEQYAGGRFSDEELADAKLLVSELVGNAYLHGEGQILLRLEGGASELRVEVIDQGEGAALDVMRAASEDGGRGLKIVERLSSAWGAHEGTTHVWAQLPLGPATR